MIGVKRCRECGDWLIPHDRPNGVMWVCPDCGCDSIWQEQAP